MRDALGIPLPPGIPDAFTEPVTDPLGDLVSRFARSHGPFATIDAAATFGLGTAIVEGVLDRLGASGRVRRGEFRPGGTGIEWCDAGVLRSIRRRSMARLRKEVEPVAPSAFGRFLPAWQHARNPLRGLDGVLRAVEQLQGAVLPASAIEQLVLPSRVADYTPAMLDELTVSGDVIWAGHGSLPGNDGWVALYLADAASVLLPLPDLDAIATLPPLAQQLLEAMRGGGAMFFRDLSNRVGSTDDRALAEALWQLGLERAGHQRLVGTAASVARQRPVSAHPAAVRSSWPAGVAQPQRSADRRRPLESAARAGHRRDAALPCTRRNAA